MSESWPDAKADSTNALKVLEDEMRHDLALHLYSVFLLHLRDPKVPKASFTSWPLSWQDVPDPKSTKTYTPEEEPFISVQQKKKDSEDAEEGELLGDPVETLRTELTGVFQRKVYDKIHSRGQEAIVEPCAGLDPVIFDELRAKFDTVIEEIFSHTSDFKKPVGPLDWRDVLLRLTGDEDYEKIAHRCRTLFEVEVRPDFVQNEQDSSVMERKRKLDALKEQIIQQKRTIKKDAEDFNRKSK